MELGRVTTRKELQETLKSLNSKGLVEKIYNIKNEVEYYKITKLGEVEVKNTELRR